MAKYAAALDQGTTSSRCMVFDHGGQVVSVVQKEHEQIYPKPGWVEHDAKEIWARCQEVMQEAMDAAGASADDISGVGITNQRETAVVWDRNTGEPVMNAIVWQDTRTDRLVDEFSRDGGQDRFREQVGLPLATYFSGPKVRWILDNVDGAAARAEAGDLLFGNIDTWCIWNLTGGTDGGVHITDVSNASRTLMMDLETLDWDDEILSALGVPRAMLPEIRPSSAVYGEVRSGGGFNGVQIAGDLGDQQAATFGQTCFEVVEAMDADSGVKLESLKVDGGMVANDLLMQFQADLLGVPVIRPQVAETTSLGAAYAAGLATGLWSEVEDLRENWQ